MLLVMLSGVCFAQNPAGVEQIFTEIQDANTPQVAVQRPVAPVVFAATPVVAAEENISQCVAESQVSLAKDSDNPVSDYLRARRVAKDIRDAEEGGLDNVTAAWSGMILRDYQLSPVALEKMRLKDAGRSTDVHEQFPDVDFPEGSKAVYRPVLNRLYILNTRENVEKLEAVLTALETPQSADKGQIEVKTRFVEFSEGALEDLGFKWENITDAKIAGDWSVLNDTPAKDSSLFTGALRGSGEVFAQPQSIGTAIGGGTTVATGDWTASRLTDQFNAGAGDLKVTGDIGPKVDLLIRALDQSSGADVLSAPTVVTRAGQKASIQVGQTHYFPDNFEVGGNEGTIVHVSYQGFTEKLMGVDLSVKPNLIKDNLIEMDLNPKVTELLGWRRYQIAPANSSYTYYQFRIGNTYKHDPIIARLPIFRHREVKTKVTIQDGSTIGMGGLISEKVESFSDRVPVLGSIPLIGRLFRSEGERTVKRNLMIFVTASKVAPNGRIFSEQSFK